MKKTYYIKAACSCCGRVATIIDYEKVLPSEILANYLQKGGSCSRCQSNKFTIVNDLRKSENLASANN